MRAFTPQQSFIKVSFCIARNVLQIDGVHSLYCRYTISYGNDWTIVHVSDYIEIWRKLTSG